MNTDSPATACMPVSAISQLEAALPWICLVMMFGLVIGLVAGWISRRAGDNAWAAARHALTFAIAPVGPLLGLVAFISTALSSCR